MTTGGWVIMVASITCVMALVGFCYYRVLSAPPSTEHTHAPLDIDTHDGDT